MQDDPEPPGDRDADDWRAWDDAPDPAPDDAPDDASDPAGAESEEIADSASPTAHDPALDAHFLALLRDLRAIPGPCAPPIGEGQFDILFASKREIVVWFVSAKDGVEQKEVAIPARMAREAWELLRRGNPVDEVALRAVSPGAGGARWLLALFAQLASVEVRHALDDDASQPEAITLHWRGE
jgi:hypothetical protein